MSIRRNEAQICDGWRGQGLAAAVERLKAKILPASLGVGKRNIRDFGSGKT